MLYRLIKKQKNFYPTSKTYDSLRGRQEAKRKVEEMIDPAPFGAGQEKEENNIMNENFLFIIPGAAVIMCLVALDRLFKIEYRKYKDRWLADKKPCGCFWKLKERSWFPAIVAFKWSLKTPQWIRKDVDAHLWLKLLRLFWILFIISIITVDYIISH